MQLLEASADVLIKPLSTVIGIVERRTTLPILANILLRKTGSRIDFLATDMEVQITTHTQVGVGTEDVAVTVLARKLSDILKTLPSAAQVKLDLEEGRMLLRCGSSRFSLQTLPAEDFPTVRIPEAWQRSYDTMTLETEIGKGITFSLPQKMLKRIFNFVAFSMAKQDIRYYLNGMLLDIKPDEITAVATDGHRLAMMQEPMGDKPLNVEPQQVILPSKTVTELHRLLDESDEPVYISIDRSQVRFVFGDVELISKLVEGTFPDYKRVIPTENDRHVLLKREEFQHSLQRAAILTANDRLKGVKLSFADNILKISAHNQEQEEAKIELPIDYPHTPVDVGFNVAYLLDVLSNVRTDDIQISVSGTSGSPAVVKVPSNEHFTYVVMPLRL